MVYTSFRGTSGMLLIILQTLKFSKGREPNKEFAETGLKNTDLEDYPRTGHNDGRIGVWMKKNIEMIVVHE